MQKLSLSSVVTMALALVSGQTLCGQSAYFQAVTNLNPVGYWPLNETIQPPAPFSGSLAASNSGTVGTSGTGYYGAWYQPSGNTWFITNNIQITNGIAGTGDNALWCNAKSTGAGSGANVGEYVVVPRSIAGVPNPNVTLKPPFSIEAWVLPNDTAATGPFGIVAEGGSPVNYGGPNTNNPYYGGTGTGYAGVVVAQYSTFFLFDCFATNGTSKSSELDSASSGSQAPIIGSWNHLVCTFDGATESMWINGVNVKNKVLSGAAVPFAPDLHTPLLIGTGPELTAQSGEGGIEMNGVLDEVAIYNEVLPSSSIAAHYAAANSTNYPTVVLSDNPTLYYRFNDSLIATNAGYPTNTFPVATNYGTLGAAANGLYQPGTTPGVAGPPFTGIGSGTAVAINGFFGGVDVGGGSLPAALNPVGTVPLTVVSWFQGNSADAPERYQDIVGHGNNSYRLALGTTCGENRFNPFNTELQFVNPTDMITNHASDNDGNWHMVAGVSDGTNAYMYLDGNLVKSTNSGTGINIPGSSIDLLLGGDPQNIVASFNSAGTVRNFDGQIAQVAFWNTNLSTAQIQSLFNAAGVPPSIVVEPVGATNNQGSSLTVTATVGGSQPIIYQWYTNNVAVAGQTGENLVYPSVTTNSIGNYYLVATSAYGSATSTVAPVFVYGPPAVSVESQSSLDIYAGSSPDLFVIATGAAPLTYQWYSNNIAVAGATSSSYTVANAQTTATYTCNVTNGVGSDVAGPFTITVLPDPTAPYPAAVLRDHPLSFFRLDESGGTTAFDYVSGYNGTYTNTLVGYAPSYDPTSDPTEGNAPGFGISVTNNSYVGWIPTNVNFATPTNVNGEFSIECWLQCYGVTTDAGVVALGYGNGGEEFALDCGGNDPSHDLRFYVRNAGGAPINAVSAVPPVAGGNIWHHVVGVCDEANASVTLYIDGTNAASGSISSKSGILTSTQSMSIGARQEAQGSQYDNQFVGAIDEVAVYDYALTAAQVLNHYNASGIAPTITELTPADVSTNVGANVTFDVTVAGTPPFSYQWLDPNNNLLSTNASLTLTNVQASQQGQYTIIVSNAYGTATGYPYLQLILGPPQIVQDISPLNQTVTLYSGLDSVSYTIVVSGSEPFSYHWYKDGSLVAGATNSTYSFTALPGTNSYYVTVTNAYTASQAGGVPAESSTATVIGLAAPQLNPANYANRIKISFPGFTGQPLTNFPALITLNPAAISGLEYSQFQTNGSDLRFTDATGTAMLPFEIDEWNDGGSSYVWVQIPVLNGANIWAYWGNPTNATDVAPGSTNVWLDANYEIVYHLKQSALPFADSTGQYPATNGVAPTPTPGVVGHGGLFDGVADYLTPGTVTLSNQFTTYAWVNLNPTANDIKTVWANQVGGYGANGFSWFVDSYQTADRITHFDSGNGAGSGADPTGGTPLPSGQWHFMVATWDQNAARATNYLDAVVNGTGTAVSSFGLTNQLDLGSFVNSVFYWDGSLDEARIQSGIASSNWITTTYLNMSQSSFVSYSSVNLAPALTIASSPGGYVFTWPAADGSFTLETTTNLDAPASWTAVTTPAPVQTNGVWEQTVAPAAGSHYFRLQNQ